MKKTKTKFLNIAIALVMFIASLSALGALAANKASAASTDPVDPTPAPSPTQTRVIYISDPEPLLGRDLLSEEFPDCDIIDYIIMVKNSTEFNFWAHTSNLKFIEDGNYEYVLLEIKTFKPDEDSLLYLFENISQFGCKIIFTCGYGLNQFSDLAFMDYAEAFYQCYNLSPMSQFVRRSVIDMVYRLYFTDRLCIFIDDRLIDENGVDWDRPVSEIINSSEYLCSLLQYLNTYYLNDFEIEIDYKEVYNKLVESGVALYVFNGSNKYINIMQERSYCKEIDDSFYVDIDIDILVDYNVAAMGIWSLPDTFYDQLKFMQGHLADLGRELPIYVIIEDPIEYAPDGLEIITSDDLEEEYGDEASGSASGGSGSSDVEFPSYIDDYINDYLTFLGGILHQHFN